VAIKFNRFEWAGSIGDIGTDLPLLIAMISAAQLDVASTFIMFGLMQMLTGFVYGLPMPMQPLKAMAVLVISQKLPASTLYAAGLVIGVLMLAFSASGLLERLKTRIPHQVVRGIQLGLGFSLIKISLLNSIFTSETQGLILALIAGVFYFVAKQKSRFPAAFIFILAGLVYALGVKGQDLNFLISPKLSLPLLSSPELHELWPAFLILVLPQFPLSLANSVIATQQTVEDLFPKRKISLKKIGLTYGVANVIAPFFSGVPLCHGSGGLAGHYGFGARTGGSVIIYGSFYLLTGLFFSHALTQVMAFFPTPILGVILFFEAIVLLGLARDLREERQKLGIALMVGAVCVLVPQGFLVGMIFGVVMSWIMDNKKRPKLKD